MLEIGRYRLASVLAGSYALDGGAMFGVVPKPLWERKMPADGQNRVRLVARCLLAIDARSPRRILVDDGLGEAWDARRAGILALEGNRGLEPELARHGLRPDDITDLVLTHLHFDHAGGTTRRGPGGMELAFPNATHHLQRRAWHWAHAPSERDRASFVAEHFEILHHQNQLHLVDGDTELFPDFELIVSEGHTPGEQLPRIRGGGSHLTFCGDVIPTRAHLRTSWVMGYDLFPLTTVEEKKMILAQALEEDGILFFEHDPEVAACRLGEKDGQPVFREAVEL